MSKNKLEKYLNNNTELEKKQTLKKKSKEHLDDKMILLNIYECGGGFTT